MKYRKLVDGKYEIISEIKKGGFGIVYYGFDRNLGKAVAIKEIEPGLLEEARYIDMFQAEAKNAAKLSHHNIVHVYDLQRTEDGHFYIIMEYIDGVDLRRILRRCTKVGEKISFDLGAYIVGEVCQALNYAHNKKDVITNEPLNLVHQDISPSNIMISMKGEVKLIDFGIARVRLQQKTDTRNKNLVLQGKLPYMSPEQLNGGTILDGRSDLFSLGVVFYEIITGERLFQDEREEKIIEAIRNVKVDTKLLDEHQIPPELQRVLLKSLQKDPSKRYQNAGEMYQNLTEYLRSRAQKTEFSKELSDFVKQLFQRTSEGDEQAPGHNVVDSTKNESDGVAKAQLWEIREFEPKATVPEIEPEIPLDLGLDLTPQVVTEKPEIELPAVTLISDEEAEEEGEDELKTIIDVVRLASRSHKKTLFLTLAATMGLFALFAGLDTLFRWTDLGKGIYDYFFPPAIKIHSIPPGARVILDDKPLLGKTPMSIPEISPGVHKLKLTYEGYPPIEKSIYVPRPGEIKVDGEKGRMNKEPYQFRFKTCLELTSNPSGAIVYLNDVRYNQKTPCRIQWEIGLPLSVAMEKEGLEKISGFSFDGLHEVEQIDDKRFWKFQKIADNEQSYYQIEGLFRKLVRINSIPSGAEIYLDDESTPVGVTGSRGILYLTLGTHEIMLKKAGFIPRKIRFEVTQEGRSEIFGMLYRYVRFLTRDATKSGDNELGARLVHLLQGDKVTPREDQTPCELVLPALRYEALFTKKGYKNTVVAIPPEARLIVVRMEPQDVLVEVLVRDALTGQPIQNARVLYQDLRAGSGKEQYFSTTNELGKCDKKLVPGPYRFKVQKFGYFEKSTEFSVTPQGENMVSFDLVVQ